MPLASCKLEFTEQDGEIDAELSAKLQAVNKTFVGGLTAGASASLLPLLSDDLKANANWRKGLNELVQIFQEAGAGHPFVLKRQFYSQYPDKGQIITVKTGEKGDHDYAITYKSPTRRSYVMVGWMEGSMKSVALLTIWNSYDGTWKLTTARAGAIKALGKDAVDWYYMARQHYGDNALVDASVCESVCEALLGPGGEGWHYHLEDDMRILASQIKSTAERDYSFPIRVGRVATGPAIFAVRPQLLDDAFYPVVHYATKLNMQDTASLSRECDSLNAHIGDIFNDIDHNNRKILYLVYSRVPKDSLDKLTGRGFIRAAAATWHY